MKKMKVLFLDDDKFSHWNMKYELSKKYLSFEIDYFYSAMEALDAISKNGYVSIITDYNMPEMNGAEFIYRAEAVFSVLPPIFGYTGDKNPKKIFGLFRSLIKVFDKKEIRECLEYINKNYSVEIQSKLNRKEVYDGTFYLGEK